MPLAGAAWRSDFKDALMTTDRPLRLFFIRHGQTENFDNPPFNGWRDAQLTEVGRRQLRDVAAGLTGIGLEAVYSSDLSRAVYGGERLAEAAGLSLTIDPQWREMHFGDWEGLTYREIAAESPDKVKKIFAHDEEGEHMTFPGGESSATFARRIEAALAALRERHSDGGRVAVVCHGGVCKVLWGLLLKIPPHVAWRTVRQDFAAVNVADFHSSGMVVAHLVNGYLGPEGYHQNGPGFDRLAGNDLFS